MKSKERQLIENCDNEHDRKLMIDRLDKMNKESRRATNLMTISFAWVIASALFTWAYPNIYTVLILLILILVCLALTVYDISKKIRGVGLL